MNKPIVKNRMKYWGSALAVSAMLFMGACGNNEQPAEEMVTAPERENVNQPIVEDTQMTMEETTANTETMQQDQNTNMNANTQRNRSGWSASSVNISKLLNEHPGVNEAIKMELSEMTTPGMGISAEGQQMQISEENRGY